MYKVIDLFAGVGGLSLGFQENYFKVVYANEYDHEIARSYKNNNPNTLVDKTDINEINIQDTFNVYKNIDIVIGGPPCQGFSQGSTFRTK